MRGKPGSRKKPAAISMAALAAIALVAAVAVTAVPAAATAAPENRTAQAAALQDPPETGTLSAAGLFTGLAKGAAGQVVNQFVGWGLSAIGIGGPGLGDISEQLGEISSQLTAIETTLGQIDNDIKHLNCITEQDQANDAITAIRNANAVYTGYVNTASEHPSAPPTAEQMAALADMVLTGAGNDNISMGFALNSIDTAMTGAGAQGILANCLVDSVVPPPTAGSTTDLGTDGAYYGYFQTRSQLTVDDFIGYYYGYETMALMLLVEAYHFDAQQAVGATNLTPDQVGQLCLNSQKYSAAALDCTLAETYTNDVYTYLGGWFTSASAGLPYTDDKLILLNAGDKPLWVRSLEDFTQALPEPNCIYPLTSADPCGVTATNSTQAAAPMQVPYDGYSTWLTPNSGQVFNLIGNRGSLTPGQYMNSVGFENAEKKIILESTTVAFQLTTDYSDLNGGLVCFFHTDLAGGQFCSQDDVQNRLTQPAPDCPAPLVFGRFEPKTGLPTDVNGFFDFATDCPTGSSQWVWAFTPQPGWLSGNPGPNAVQYRWPLVLTGNPDCTNGRKATNTQGVLTRCGADYDALFNRLVPRPASCAGTTVGECDQQVQVALSGPDVSGKWSAPVSADDVSVTYDGDTARTIIGTAELPATGGGSPATVTFKIRRGEGAKGTFYNGTVTIQIDGQQPLVVPLRHAELRHLAHTSVSGQVVWPRGNHGTYTLSYAVLDTA
jgi:hypothetical protein